VQLIVNTPGGAVNLSKIDNTLYCSFAKRLDGYVCAAFEQDLSVHVTEFKKSHEDARMVFDLDGVVFISSVFLRLCLIYLKTFGKDRFTIVNVSDDVRKAFHVSGFAEIMNVIPTAIPSPVPAGS